MLHVDIIPACCLGSASALVAAGMLLLADVGDAAMARAIRVLVAGFVVLAGGMLALGLAVGDGAPRHPLVLLGTESVLACTALVGGGFATLCEAWPHRALARPLVLLLALDAIVWTQWPAGFEEVSDGSGLLVALAIARGPWRVAGVGATRAQRAVTAAFALDVGAWAIRFGFTAAGVHVPPLPAPWLGVFDVMVPLVIVALAFTVANEHLAGRLRALAHTDELTGALSRRALSDRAPVLLARQRADGLLVAALMIAIDHFQGVNDRHGRPAGDAVLRRTAHLVAMNLCSDATVARHGGEAFAVLLPVAGLGEARAAAERLRKAIEADVVEFDGAGLGVTISVGLALVAADEALDLALARADKALQRARGAGRNRVDIALAAA